MEQRQAQGEQGLLSKQVTAELAAIGKQRFQDFVSAQDELLNQLRKLNEIWLDRLRSDANLASEFTAKLTEARSIPEAMSASQEWTTRRLQMMAEDGAPASPLSQAAARRILPFVIARHWNEAAGAFERITKDWFGVDGFRPRIEGRHPQFFERLAPPPRD